MTWSLLPEIGRWLTQDPLGFVDGTNLYAYVSNSPINFVDPYGLQEISIPVVQNNPPPDGSGSAASNYERKGGDGGSYFRHYTSQSGQSGIRETGYVDNSSDGEYGPGAYFTTELYTPGDVQVTGSIGDYYVDVWVPNEIQTGGNWRNWGGGQYTYFMKGEPGYPIYGDPYHPPIFGKT